MEILLIARIALLIFITSSAFIVAENSEAAQSSVTFLHGDGYASGDDTRNTLRLDTLAVKDWGMVYGRADVTSFDDRNANVFTRGVVHVGQGAHLAGQIQNQKGVSQTQVGVGYGAFKKDVAWFVDVYKVNSNYYGDGLSVFGYGSINITDRIKATGFIETLNSDREPMIFSQSSLSYKAANVWIGVEHHRYSNKNGVKGLDEAVNQIFMKWEF